MQNTSSLLGPAGISRILLALAVWFVQPAVRPASAAEQCQSVAPTHCPPCACSPRPQDQLWLVNTRGLECGPAVDDASKFKYSRRDAKAGWVASSLQEFL